MCRECAEAVELTENALCARFDNRKPFCNDVFDNVEIDTFIIVSDKVSQIVTAFDILFFEVSQNFEFSVMQQFVELLCDRSQVHQDRCPAVLFIFEKK